MLLNLVLAASITSAYLAEPRRLECPDQILVEWPEPKQIPPLVAVRDLIYFEADGLTLSEVGRSTLEGVAKCYRAIGSDTFVYVIGHADTYGTAEASLSLSQLYAEVVRDHLIEEGIPRSAMSVHSFGDGRPQVDTDDGVREPRNRRVEILFDARPRG